mmetsp:Transcript_10393/g.15129  ORF Transcript_10393/g.15129 Transcript_10393/m.15129 type:complete len:97 (+) Transcript_10393:160-450(+)
MHTNTNQYLLERSKDGPSFKGLFASHHATEFTVGPLFVGRLLGNVLATLSWRCICAPIATRERLKAYMPWNEPLAEIEICLRRSDSWEERFFSNSR